jgi:plastocyanin
MEARRRLAGCGGAPLGAADALALVAVLVLAVASCTSGKAPSSPSTTAGAAATTTSQAPSTTAPPASATTATTGGKLLIGGQQANNHGTENVADEADEEVDAHNYYFEPTILKGQPGQRLRLQLENDGNVVHNFSLPGQGISKDIQPRRELAVTVTFPRSGLVGFFCKYHRARGMLGGLSVA